MISAGATQKVNHVLSSVGGKPFHYFITNPYRHQQENETQSGSGLWYETH